MPETKVVILNIEFFDQVLVIITLGRGIYWYY